MTSALIQRAFERYQAGDLAAAERACRQALAENERLADGWLLLGVLADHAKQPADAEQFLRNATQLAPSDVRIWNTLGTIRDGAGDLDGARAAYDEALRIKPDYVPALHNLGEVERSLGRHRRAAARYRQALAVEPHLAAAQSNLLFSLHFDPELTDEQIWASHRQWGEALAARVPVFCAHANVVDPDRPLVIGYISPDFREHAVARFFEPLLASHDRTRHRYVLYSECPIIDDVGQRLRTHGDTWRVVRGQPAAAVAQQVQTDQVDILIDLAGHTRDNRLDVLALRPAPVQMTFLGYPYPTGLPTIDYRITDGVLDPLDAPARTGFGESVIRLPDGVCCFQPPANAPEITHSKSSGSPFTFGCHHPLTKLNIPLLKLWSEIAQAVPTARFLCVRNSWDGAVSRELRTMLAEVGLPAERVELRKSSIAPGDYLRTIAEMDLILDALPFNGHTMTCEALWMGVPVLTLRGDRPAGRLSSSVLTALGLHDFIAESTKDYVSKALAFAQNPTPLVAVRQGLRERMRRVLGDGRRFAQPLEVAWREAWRTWCRSRRNSQTVPAISNIAAPVVPMMVAANEPWDAVHARGCALLEAGDADTAAELFRQASTLNPDVVPPRAMLAGILSDRCDLTGAAEQYALALKAGPDAKVRIAAAAALPPIYHDHQQIEACRATLVERLETLHRENVRLDPMRGPIPNLFFVAYQGHNDREIMKTYAALFTPGAWAREPIVATPRSDGRIGIGILSQYLCNHTIGTLNLGLVRHLDRTKFHVSIFAAAKNDDLTSKQYRELADEYIELPADTAAAARLVRSRRLCHVLFTDLGMSCVTLALAHSRLGQRQSMLWGHPLTTGIPTIDDFLSASIFESEGAQEHYSERLVCLDGINTCYERPKLDRAYSRAEFNLPADATLYGCPQTLFKMHPDIDAIFQRILAGDPAGRLVLIEGRNKHWKEHLLARWRRTMPDAVAQIIWLPTLDKASYLGFTSICDVMLDPPHFGGGNTTLEAFALGVPVVTLPTPYLRARFTQGYYRHIGIEDLIAADAVEYVRMALDRDRREHVREKLKRDAHALFDLIPSVRAFERYFGFA